MIYIQGSWKFHLSYDNVDYLKQKVHGDGKWQAEAYPLMHKAHFLFARIGWNCIDREIIRPVRMVEDWNGYYLTHMHDLIKLGMVTQISPIIIAYENRGLERWRIDLEEVKIDWQPFHVMFE